MKLGISSYACTWAMGIEGFKPPAPLDLVGLLNRCEELGVRLLQVADNLPLHLVPPDELKQFIRRAGETGVEIETGTAGFQPDHLRKYVSIAQRAGSGILRVVIDTRQYRPDEEEIKRTLRDIVPDLESAGIKLAIENHDRFPSEKLIEFVQAAGSDSVGVCLDTTNSLALPERVEEVVETLGPFAVNLHLKDYEILRSNQMMGFRIEGRPVGQGRLDTRYVLGRLRDFGRDPNAILELWTPAGDSLETTIEKEYRWLKESVQYLRQYIPD